MLACGWIVETTFRWNNRNGKYKRILFLGIMKTIDQNYLTGKINRHWDRTSTNRKLIWFKLNENANNKKKTNKIRFFIVSSMLLELTSNSSIYAHSDISIPNL